MEDFPFSRKSYVNSSMSTPKLICITCSFPHSSCSFNNIHLSKRSTFIVQECLGPGIPFSRVINNLQTFSEVFRLDDNTKFSESVKKFSLPKVKNYTVPMLHSKVPAGVRLFLSGGICKTDEFSFPMVVEL